MKAVLVAALMATALGGCLDISQYDITVANKTDGRIYVEVYMDGLHDGALICKGNLGFSLDYVDRCDPFIDVDGGTHIYSVFAYPEGGDGYAESFTTAEAKLVFRIYDDHITMEVRA